MAIRKRGKYFYFDYYEPDNGERIREVIRDENGKKVTSERKAESYLAKVVVSKKENRYFDVFDVKKETKITFNKLLDEYVKKIEEREPKDRKYYDTSVKYFIPILREHFGDKLLSEINYKALEDFRDLRKRTPTQHRTERSERTVNLEMATLRHIFRKGFKWEMLEKNPFDRGDLFYRARNRRERALTGNEIGRLLDACPAYLRFIVFTAIHTGLRKGDILNLKWRDIDLEVGIIRVEEAKTQKIRTIILNNDMIVLLKSLHRGDSQYVFPGKNGKPFKDIKRSFQTALKDAMIEQHSDRRLKIVFHSLRHSCVSLLKERGADSMAVQSYVDHASQEMTARYTHLTDEYVKRTGDLLNGLYDVSKIFCFQNSHKWSQNGSESDRKEDDMLPANA